MDDLWWEERTPLPPFNALKTAAHGILQAGAPLHGLDRELEELDLALGHLQHAFYHELRFREDSPVLARHLPEVGRALNRLRDLLLELAHATEHDHPETMPGTLHEAHQRVDRLFRALDALREEEQQRPRESPAHVADEFLRCAGAVLRGTLSPDLFRERLESVWDAHRVLKGNLAPGSPDWSPRAQELVELHERGLQEAERFLRVGDPALLHAAVQAVRDASHGLVEVQRRLEGEGSAEVACVRCGRPTPPTRSTCPACGMRLPPNPQSRVDLRLEDGVMTESGTQVPENLRPLLAAVQRIRAGEDATADLRQATEWLLGRAFEVSRGLENVPAPPAEAPAEQLQAYAEARQRFLDGLGELEEGLHLLNVYAEERDGYYLDLGEQRVLSGTRGITSVGDVWRDLLATYQQQQP